MIELQPPDTFVLSAAVGWFELGNNTEAQEELKQLSQVAQSAPQVLEFRWMLAADEKRWEDCLQITTQAMQLGYESEEFFIHRSYALHELKKTAEAHENLLPAFQKFPRNSIIPYNLGCYCCQLTRYGEAVNWLKAAAARSSWGEIRSMALGDPDLKPIHGEIARIKQK